MDDDSDDLCNELLETSQMLNRNNAAIMKIFIFFRLI